MPVRSFDGIVPTLDPTAFVHPDAVVIGDVHVGADSSLWPGVVVRGDVNRIRIGARVNVQDGAILHVARPTDDLPQGLALIIGDGVSIAHGVILHACTLEADVMVGMGATVMDGVWVGRGAMVGAGALVPPGKRIEPGELWLGSPAKRVRLLSAEEQDKLARTNANYVLLAHRHRLALAADAAAGRGA
ncbi:MAG: gamma carbonic anhydrase family protein [Magnetococcus sp. WYHC-3]